MQPWRACALSAAAVSISEDSPRSTSHWAGYPGMHAKKHIIPATPPVELLAIEGWESWAFALLALYRC